MTNIKNYIIILIIIIVVLLTILIIVPKKKVIEHASSRKSSLYGYVWQLADDPVAATGEVLDEVIRKIIKFLNENGAINDEEKKALLNGVIELNDFMSAFADYLPKILTNSKTISDSIIILITRLYNNDLPKIYNEDPNGIQHTLMSIINRFEHITPRINGISQCFSLIEVCISSKQILRSIKLISFTFKYIIDTWAFIQYTIKYNFISLFNTDPPLNNIFNTSEYKPDIKNIKDACISILEDTIIFLSSTPSLSKTILNGIIIGNIGLKLTNKSQYNTNNKNIKNMQKVLTSFTSLITNIEIQKEEIKNSLNSEEIINKITDAEKGFSAMSTTISANIFNIVATITKPTSLTLQQNKDDINSKINPVNYVAKSIPAQPGFSVDASLTPDVWDDKWRDTDQSGDLSINEVYGNYEAPASIEGCNKVIPAVPNHEHYCKYNNQNEQQFPHLAVIFPDLSLKPAYSVETINECAKVCNDNNK